MRRATLYLIPSGLGGPCVIDLLPPATLAVVRSLEYFIAENARSARAFLKAAGHPRPLRELDIQTLDEHTPGSEVGVLLRPLEQGIDCGLVSEAGCPAVADPGAGLVRAAHESGLTVAPLVGPSAVLLAVMASGMNGQRFAFHGYLPVERAARAKRLVELERASEERGETQLFIEAPYRNEALFSAILETCRGDTWLSLATDLTLTTQSVHTRRISNWKGDQTLDRRPTVFLLYREQVRPDQKR